MIPRFSQVNGGFRLTMSHRQVTMSDRQFVVWMWSEGHGGLT